MGYLAIIAIIVGSGCAVHDRLVACDDGRACPVSTVCDDAHATCVDPGQIASCDGLADGAACDAVLDGVCVGGVCFAARCGDGIVEAGEACDDGNHDAGDGCAADCRSTEQCGNGILEPSLGEACDDGNSASGDGCDSRCQIETLTWSLLQCGEPTNMTATNTTYDAVRGKVVSFDDGRGSDLRDTIYEWDGQHWSCDKGPLPVMQSGPQGQLDNPLSGARIVWDPDRQRVVMFADQVYEWDGVTTTQRTTTRTPSFGLTTYDTIGHRFLIYDPSVTSTMNVYDNATATWTTIAIAGTVKPLASVMAFDSTRGVIVAIAPYSTTTATFEWAPSTQAWTRSVGPQSTGVALVDDRALQRVVAYDPSTAALASWNGAWNPIATTGVPPSRIYPMLAYDPSNQNLVLAGGLGGGPGQGDVVERVIWRWDGTSWSGIAEDDLIPKHAQAAPFPSRGEIVVVSTDYAASTSTSETAVWRGAAWETLAITTPPNLSALAYDPSTDRVVGATSNELWAFDGSTWVRIAQDATGQTMTAIVYDADRAALIGVGSVATQSEALYERTATGWQALGPTPPGTSTSLAYDRRAHAPVVVESGQVSASLQAYELVAGAWIQIFSFEGYPTVVALEQRASMMFVDNSTRPTWERIGDAWTQSGAAPDVTSDLVVPDPARAQLLAIDRSSGRVQALGYTSAIPRETCADGIDADGDGKVGCADDDCWWKCKPACPPLASCP